MTEPTTIGIIAPNKGRHNEVEFPAVFPEHYQFLITGLRIGRVDAAGVDRVIPKIEGAAQALEGAGAEMLLQCGTPLGVVKGAGFDEDLADRIEAAAGVPATTMNIAIVEALQTIDVRNLAIAAPYSDEMLARLDTFMSDYGFDVVGRRNLDITDPDEMNVLEEDDIYRLGEATLESSGDADGLFFACGGIPTLEPIERLEAEFGVPAISGGQASMWKCLRMTGHGAPIPGYGSLLGRPLTA